jgi:prephenate dehydrogenase
VNEKRVQRLAVVGTGLIGASVGLAAKRSGVEQVRGYDLDQEALDVALRRRAIDAAAPDLPSTVADSELVVVATPVGVSPALVAASLEATGRPRTVTDVGSTKGGICTALARQARFVGGHPLCGAETRGPGMARADMFEHATWFLTPLAATEPESYGLVESFVSLLGARPVAIDPDVHDRLVALTSHLPHALANLVLSQVGSTRVAGHDPLEAAAGGSLRDLARIAGANPQVWSEIFLENADAIAASLAGLRERLEELEAALVAKDAAFLRASIEEAARHRRRLSDASAPSRPAPRE